MRWPFWFPYPGAFAYCLLMLVLMSISLLIVGPIAWAVMLFAGGASVLTEALTGDPAVVGLVVLVGLVLLALVDSLFLAWGYQVVGYVLKLMDKEKPAFHSIPPWKYWRDAWFANFTFSLGIGAATVSWLLILCKAGECQRQDLTDGEVTLIATAALVLMVYCYHLRILRWKFYERQRKRKEEQRRRRNVEKNRASLPKVQPRSKSPKPSSRSVKRPPPPPPSPPPKSSSLDDELEELKRQMRDKGQQ